MACEKDLLAVSLPSNIQEKVRSPHCPYYSHHI